MAKIETNRISKIYNQVSKETIQFKHVEEAKNFFLSDQAIETFNKYGFRQQFELTNENKSLHWTLSFELDTNPSKPGYIPASDLWRDTKQAITDRDEWFVHPNWPDIDHEAKHLF